MAIPVVNDVYTVKLTSFLPNPYNQLGICLLHYKCTNFTLLGATETEVADRFATILTADFKALITSTANFLNTIIQRIDPLPVLMPVSSIINNGPCTGAAAMAPTQTCGLLSKVTPYAGQAFRGRCYLPFPPANRVDTTGLPTAAYLTLCTTFANDINQVILVTGAFGTSSWSPVIWHPKGYHTPPVGVRTTDPITNIFNNAKFATLRRRGSYGRQNP